MIELEDEIVEREEAFTDDWYMVRKMDRTPTFAEAINWADTHPNWIKVEDRLPEAKYRNDIEKGYSDIVLVCGFRYTPKGVRCRFSDAAYYDHEYRKWYDQNDDAIAGGVTNWMPIILPIEEDEE